MDAGRKGQDGQDTIGGVDLRQHVEPVRVAGFLAVQADAAVDQLLTEDVQLLAQHVVDGPHDLAAQGGPDIDGHDRRDVVLVQLRRGRAFAGPLDLGDRQNLVPGHVLGGEQQPHIQGPKLQVLIAAPAALVLDRDGVLLVAHVLSGIGLGHVRPTHF